MDKKIGIRKGFSRKYYFFAYLFNIAIIAILSFVEIILLNKVGIDISKFPNIDPSLIYKDSFFLILIILVGLFLLLMIFTVLGSLIGLIKGTVVGKHNITREERKIKLDNPYLYFRELPNSFGIGVSTLLLDSELESYKDVVAVILDLCAKGYLKMQCINNKYVLKVVNNDISKLLDNEKYIIECINNKCINNINYNHWYDLCLKDGIDLGLFNYRNEQNKFKDKGVKFNIKPLIYFSFFASIIIFALACCFSNISSFLDILMLLFYAFLLPLVGIIVIGYFPYSILSTFISFFRMGKKQQNIVYKNILNSKLLRTDKGKEELHKLLAFKKFIYEFGRFVDKKVDEVVLWDYYLSYAQLFGLTKEIMKSGYKQLIENSSFVIDNIDNINMNNIDYEGDENDMKFKFNLFNTKKNIDENSARELINNSDNKEVIQTTETIDTPNGKIVKTITKTTIPVENANFNESSNNMSNEDIKNKINELTGIDTSNSNVKITYNGKEIR